MKKRLLAAATLLVLTFSLTACGKFKCDGCGEEKSGKQHKVEVLGYEGVLCDDCYNDIKSLGF